MTEMRGVSRFFVNRFTGRRNARAYGWIGPNLGVGPGASFLEIGCGSGDLAWRVVEGLRPARYVATDLDPRQIDVARERLASRYPAGLPASLELRAADMLSLPFPDASLDVVLALYSLHHADEHHRAFRNVPRALAEVDRVLRPGGHLGYLEIVNKEQVRGWLEAHGYRVRVIADRWTTEAVVAAKPGYGAWRVVPGTVSAADS